MAKSNTFDNIAEGATIDSTSSVSSGDAIGRSVTGTPTNTATSAAALFGARGQRVVGISGDIDQSSFTAPTTHNEFSYRIYFKIATSRLPGGTNLTASRGRSSSGNIWKFVYSTSGVCSIQNSLGSSGVNFNGGTKPADGYYCMKIWGTVGTTTSNGSFTAKLYSVDTTTYVHTQVGSTISSTTYNLGTNPLSSVQWAKTESSGSCDQDYDGVYLETGAGAAVEPPDAVPPSVSYTLLKTINFENGTNGQAVSITVPSSASGQATFDLVQTNSQINRLGNAAVVNGNLSLEMEQNAGSTNQINNYINLGSLYSDIGITTMIRFSKAPTNTFTFLRLFADTTYTSTEVNCSMQNSFKPTLGENGQATINAANSIAANTWYCMQLRYRAGTNAFTLVFYQRGTNTIVSSMTGTLASATTIGSLRFGIGSTVDTGNIRVTMDDFQVAANGLPDRTDIGNIPPVVLTLVSSKSTAAAGGTVAITADASDADGTVADAIWDITATNGITPPTLNNKTVTAAQFYARAALVDYSCTITYIAVDDQGAQSEMSSIVVNINKATEILSNGPGVDPTPLVWYVAQ